MTISVFDLFSVGIGPSSSHTVGPMRAAARFVSDLRALDALPAVADIRVDLYGSLAATGAGHGTMSAVLLGLEGYFPEKIETEEMERRLEEMRSTRHIRVGGSHEVALAEDEIVLHPLTILPLHPNGMRITASTATGIEIHSETYFSIGGGFVVTEAESAEPPATATGGLSFGSAKELLDVAARHGYAISDVMLQFERETRSTVEIYERLLHIRDVMVECEKRGIARDGILPGALRVRRAPGTGTCASIRKTRTVIPHSPRTGSTSSRWPSTRRTHPVAGSSPPPRPTGPRASSRGAALRRSLHPGREVGSRRHRDPLPPRRRRRRIAVQGTRVDLRSRGRLPGRGGFRGVHGRCRACGDPRRHNRTGGECRGDRDGAQPRTHLRPHRRLVQIPCIERNAISAGKAINAARMALRGDGTHRVSLDQVIETMRSTGADMLSKYKETSTGGLAVNVPVNYVEC